MFDNQYLLDVPEEIDYLEPHATLKENKSKKATIYSEKTGDQIGESWNTVKISLHLISNIGTVSVAVTMSGAWFYFYFTLTKLNRVLPFATLPTWIAREILKLVTVAA